MKRFVEGENRRQIMLLPGCLDDSRTLKRVSTEMSLHVLAYNLKRVIAIVIIAPLVAAIRA